MIDIAGRQHHAAPSQIQIWAAHANLRLRSHRVWIKDGIDRLRTFLRDPGSGEPRITINPRCQALIREFANYRYHEPREHRPISELPIDADNHAIKALCYWLFDRFGYVGGVGGAVDRWGCEGLRDGDGWGAAYGWDGEA